MAGSSMTDCAEREIVDSEDEDSGTWDDWAAGTGADEEAEASENVQCLFCAERRSSSGLIFEHCVEQHSFDFVKQRRERRMEFYESLRLINYIRSEVAANGPENALAGLLQKLNVAEHAGSSTSTSTGEENNVEQEVDCCGLSEAPWNDDKYLAPFLANDSLLYTFDNGDEEFEDLDTVDNVNTATESLIEDTPSHSNVTGPAVTPPRVTEDVRQFLLATPPEIAAHASALLAEEMSTEGAPDLEDDCLSDGETQVDELDAKSLARTDEPRDTADGAAASSDGSSESLRKKKKKGKVTFATVADKEKLNINRSYFGSYSGFGIHREMLGDKVRTEAYQSAIVDNPSLLKDSVVMDVGCGTGILSLFAAKAGARKVIAVDGSEKMTAVATQVAKANAFLDESAGKEEQGTNSGVICVVAGIIEELESTMPIKANSVDVLVSEWMGYCLLFESMLGSVLYARDKWLKPGGAMLPDTASMYVAGFGKGGTSLSFWEDVYGFDMQCVGDEIVHDATQHPIIDVIPSQDVITDTCLVKEFDLTTMKHEDVDYTSDFHVKLLPSALERGKECTNRSRGPEQKSPLMAKSGDIKVVKCYGLVVWFDTGFTSRFCRDKPINLSTSPHTPKTHWSQTLLTFKEPISLCLEDGVGEHQIFDKTQVGSDASPAHLISGRISIARSFRYRSIDISLETTALGAGGASKSWPVQMFDI